VSEEFRLRHVAVRNERMKLHTRTEIALGEVWRDTARVKVTDSGDLGGFCVGGVRRIWAKSFNLGMLPSEMNTRSFMRGL
jgi:hypothetical protein